MQFEREKRWFIGESSRMNASIHWNKLRKCSQIPLPTMLFLLYYRQMSKSFYRWIICESVITIYSIYSGLDNVGWIWIIYFHLFIRKIYTDSSYFTVFLEFLEYASIIFEENLLSVFVCEQFLHIQASRISSISTKLESTNFDVICGINK